MFKSLLQVLKQRNLMIQALDTTEAALDRAERISGAAFDHLLEGTDPGFNVYLEDQEINRAAVDVRRMIFEHLVLDPDGDLTPGLILTSIIIDIERIGDYGKNVEELVERYGRPLPDGEHHNRVRALAAEVKSMFTIISGSLREGNTETARNVMDKHRDVGRRCEQEIDAITQSDLPLKDGVVLALACRFLKRISAHLSNLASSVVNPFDRIGFTPEGDPPQDAD